MLLQCFAHLICVIVLIFLSVGVCVANDSQTAKTLANGITGLNTLTGVSIDVKSVELAEDDDTPIPLFKDRLIAGSLWKVSYKIDALQHENKTNPHIVGFDVYVDISIGRVLKIVSRDAEGLAEQYVKGIKVSNRQVRSIFKNNPRRIKDAFPTVNPTFKFVDFLIGKGIECRHYECYYILSPVPNNDNPIPRWLIILYGTEPHHPLGPIETRPLNPPKLADGYLRTFQMHFVDAMSGQRSPYAYITGFNTDTFR